jgi:hypothetical protein
VWHVTPLHARLRCLGIILARKRAPSCMGLNVLEDVPHTQQYRYARVHHFQRVK